MLLRFAAVMGLLAHPRARHLLVTCGLVTGLVLALGSAWQVVEARRDDIAGAKRELKNLSLVLSEETDRAFQSMELVQLGLVDHLREQGIDTPEKFDRELTSQAVQQDLQHRIAALPHISAVALISRGGYVVSVSQGWPIARIDVTDRDFFQAFMQDPSRSPFIGAPVQIRSTGAWAILFARAFVGPDGRLIGIVDTIFELNGFERLFARLAVSGDASFSLFRGDGVLLARHPRVDADIGRNYGANRDFHSLAASVDREVLVRESLIDGQPRLIAPHSVAHYPLILSATDTVRARLAPWRARTRWTAGVTTLAEIVLGAIILLGVRQARGQERLLAADAAAMRAETGRTLAESQLALARQREVSERAAHQQSQRFDVALSNMLQGLMMCDTAGCVLVLNQRLIEMFGLPADAARTASNYAEIVDLTVGCGNVTMDDMASLTQWRETTVAGHARAIFSWELADGRRFTVTHQPMPDGWLATYEDTTASRRSDLRLAYMARHDALTDLPNRVLFREKLEEALAQARRDTPLALLCLDLDQFKAVNDTLGHPVGDALLQAVANRLMERTRESDTVARLGGDEFAIVQAPIATPNEAAHLADRLIEMLSEPFHVAGHQIVIGTSVGIAFAPQDGLDADQLLKCADLALYRAKLEGRGVYRLFQIEMDAQMQARRLLELDLRGALRGGQLELFYQPLIDLRARCVAGFEALLRWRHPAKGLISPGAFIPLAEEIGAIVPIGEWILQRACAAAIDWPNDLKVAVNLSPVQFKSRNLVAATAAALKDSGLAPDRLELEITETVMLQDTADTLTTLQELHALGVRIAMDDFGTGYSSLSYLRQFPFDRLKIDQSFIRELGKQRDCSAIVRAVTTLSHELGMATTAEGVETQDQLNALALAGCTHVQGYLFSQPVPESAIAELLRSMPAVRDLLPPGTVIGDPWPHPSVDYDTETAVSILSETCAM